MVEYINIENDDKVKVKIFKFGKYSFSSIELKHLLIAYLLTSLTLYFISLESVLFNFSYTFFQDLLFLLLNLNFLMFILAFGFAFILHEIGHKITAQYYGFISEFRADINMMLIILVLALLSPFILIAPGAVMILGRPSVRQNGIISLAGPLVNLGLTLLSMFLLLFLNLKSSLFLIFLQNSIYINLILGIFNMLPFWVLDGKKVLAWNWKIYLLTISSLLLLLYIFL